MANTYTLSELRDAESYAYNRLRAERGACDKIDEIALALALAILQLLSSRRIGMGTLLSEDVVLQSMIDALVSEAESEMWNYISAYSALSADALDDDSEFVDTYITGKKIGDETFRDKNTKYVIAFAAGITGVIASLYSAGKTKAEVEAHVKKNYSSVAYKYLSDYRQSSISTYAIRDTIWQRTGSFGQGIDKEPLRALKNAVSGEIALAWQAEGLSYHSRKGAKGFYVVRGSSYPCSPCQDNVGKLFAMTEGILPVHRNCHCLQVFVY